MKQKYIQAYMDVAERFAQLSYAERLKVGAIAVKDNRIISIGYNGTPAGDDNTCEHLLKTYDQRDVDESWTHDEQYKFWFKLKTKSDVIHAERNLLDKLAGSNESARDSIIFCTHGPCLECAKSIYNSGVSAVYYRHEYRDSIGIDFLNRHNVPTRKV